MTKKIGTGTENPVVLICERVLVSLFNSPSGQGRGSLSIPEGLLRKQRNVAFFFSQDPDGPLNPRYQVVEKDAR